MKPSIVVAAAVVVILAVFAAGCDRSEPSAPQGISAPSPLPLLKSAANSSTSATIQPAGDDIFSSVNAALEARGEQYRLVVLEYITAPGSGEFGATIFAKNVGNKQLAHHFVSGDPRRSGRTNITYIVDEVDANATGGLGGAQTQPAIDNAMQTWNQELCSPSITKVALPGPVDLGVVQFIEGFGGIGAWAADVTHAGWLPGAFFDAIAPPDGSTFILGVTFTFLWIDGAGNFTDIDRDGKLDAAFREIYYNNAFTWTDASPEASDPEVDVETIALHEAGHGLSQGHFGTIFFDGKGTTTPSLQHLHFSPRAVMNAIYWDTQRDLLGTDKGGHCSIWSSWQQ